MPTSTRFAVGIHLLTALAVNDGRVVRSEQVAGSVNTNAVVVRRLFSALAEAGLVRARLGQGGGFELARPAGEITLLDVYRAVEEAELFAAPRSAPDPGCFVGCHVQAALRPATERARCAMEAELARTSIADIARAVRERAADAAAPLA